MKALLATTSNTQIVDSKTIPATNDLGTFVMAQERQSNTSKLLGIPLEIREMILGHLDEGLKISLLDLEGADEDGLKWTTENMTKEEYEDRFHPRTPVAIDNVATSNATTNWRTIHPRLVMIAHVVPYVLTVAWIFCKDIANAMDGFIWFLTAISIVTALEPLQTNRRQLVPRRQFSNLRNRLHRAAEVMAKTVSWLWSQLPSRNRVVTRSDTITSLLMVNKQIQRETKLAYLRSHSHALSEKALHELCRKNPVMGLEYRESIRSILIPPIVANNRAEIKNWRRIFRQITRALPNVRSVEIRMIFSGPIERTPAGPSFRAFEDTGRSESGLQESTATERRRVTWEPSFFRPFRKWNLTQATVSVEVSNVAAWRSVAAPGKAHLEGTRFSREIQRAMLSTSAWRQHLMAEQDAVSRQISVTTKEGLSPFITPLQAFVLDERREGLESTLCEIEALFGTL